MCNLQYISPPSLAKFGIRWVFFLDKPEAKTNSQTDLLQIKIQPLENIQPAAKLSLILAAIFILIRNCLPIITPSVYWL